MDWSRLRHYWLHRHRDQLVGATVEIAADDVVIATARRLPFRLRTEIRIAMGNGAEPECLWIRSRNFLRFGGSYDVIEPASGRRLGVLRRHGFRSLCRDTWSVFGEHGGQVGSLLEDSAGWAFLRRWTRWRIPQAWCLRSGGNAAVVMMTRTDATFDSGLEVAVPAGHVLEARVVLAIAVLLLCVEPSQ